jgi:hypothetical protein
VIDEEILGVSYVATCEHKPHRNECPFSEKVGNGEKKKVDIFSTSAAQIELH